MSSKMNKIALNALILLSIPVLVIGQLTKFKKYGAEQGICSNQIYAIEQDKNGFIWFGTGDGLCRYDGFNFTSKGTDTLAQGTVGSIFKDSRQNLWIGYQNGTVLKNDGESIFVALSPETTGSNSIVDIIEIEGQVAFVTQTEGLIWAEVDNGKKNLDQGFDQFYMTALESIDAQKLLAGTFQGLHLLQVSDGFANVEIIKSFEELEYLKIQDIEKVSGNKYLIATEDAGLFQLDIADYSIENLGTRWGIEYENIQDIFVDPGLDIWLSTFGAGIIRVKYDIEKEEYTQSLRYNQNNGLGANNIKEVFKDFEGNYWVATYSDGAALLTNEAFTFYEFDDLGFNKNITAVASFANTTWYASPSGIIEKQSENGKKYTLINKGIPNDRISCLFFDSESLWFGTANNGLYKIDGKGAVQSVILENNSLARSINHITGSTDTLWVSTKNGVYVLLNGHKEKMHFSTSNGLGHNNIHQVFIDNENNAWIASKSSGLKFLDADLRLHSIYDDYMSETEYISIEKDKDNNIWAATSMYGVFRFGQDTVINFNVREGLISPYCYSMGKDNNGMFWIGHRQGLSRIDPNNLNVKAYGNDIGILGDCNSNAMSITPSKELIIGTTQGIVIYDPAKEHERLTKPKLNFISVRISYGETDIEFDAGEDIVLPYNQYRIRIDFIGLSYNAPEEVRYQYKLDGYDEWSDLSNMRYASYGKISDGNYTFMVKACNEASVCNEEPLTLNIKVKKPFWKMWWFFLIMAALLVLVVATIIKVRERNQKAFQVYLQKKLDERTHEVVKQKEEIEVKNRDITDSINYAQRIQASILPSIRTLQDHFSGSFVFYQPRDIVSGDFYWFGVTKNNKFIIVCADSTGHGVPGAFMSMIGTILIKDICAREDVTKPSDILSLLDTELSNTLNQNLDAERSNDGMDIIVCEIDIKSHYARMASAMRPIIVYQNGQQIYVKGSRNSVGGHIQKELKVFENEGFQLSKGDIIYMFSDGYPDQFGGPMEKKFKMVRLKNLLKDIHQKPMEEQYIQVKQTFNLWKEGMEQVDDVLFMGIKI
jgi:ligand-binding sensor domain-containing protein/serine phosphatase RsbU (regulator of sigma subunit)